MSNDPNGVNVYGEGAAAFTNNTDASTIPISQAVYYLSSTSGSPADGNTGFSPGTPFMQTGGMVSGGGYAGPPPTIAYTVYPAPIATSSTANCGFLLGLPVEASADCNERAILCLDRLHGGGKMKRMRPYLLLFAFLAAIPLVVDASIQQVRAQMPITITLVVTNPSTRFDR